MKNINKIYLINVNLAWRIAKKVKGVFNSID